MRQGSANQSNSSLTLSDMASLAFPNIFFLTLCAIFILFRKEDYRL